MTRVTAKNVSPRGKKECPEGGRFGEHCDKFGEECWNCEIRNECREAQDKIAADEYDNEDERPPRRKRPAKDDRLRQSRRDDDEGDNAPAEPKPKAKPSRRDSAPAKKLSRRDYDDDYEDPEDCDYNDSCVDFEDDDDEGEDSYARRKTLIAPYEGLRAILNKMVARPKAPLAVIDLLGHHAAELLTEICYAMTNPKRSIFIVEDENREIWYRQNFKWIKRHIGLTTDERLITAKKKLENLGFIEVKEIPRGGGERCSKWRPNLEKTKRFIEFCYAVRNATAPVNYLSLHKWKAYAEKNPSVVKEFGGLIPKELRKKIGIKSDRKCRSACTGNSVRPHRKTR